MYILCRKTRENIELNAAHFLDVTGDLLIR